MLIYKIYASFFFFTKWMRSSSRGIATLMTDLNIKTVGVDLVKQL